MAEVEQKEYIERAIVRARDGVGRVTVEYDGFKLDAAGRHPFRPSATKRVGLESAAIVADKDTIAEQRQR